MAWKYPGVVVTGDREKAMDARRVLLELRPNDVITLNNLGVNYYYWLRDYAHAEEMFRRRLEIDSLAGSSWLNLARTLFDQGRFDEAEETLQQWAAKLPEATEPLHFRALFASALGEYGDAEAYLSRLGLPRISGANFNRLMARLMQVQGKLDEADGYFLNAMADFEEGDRPTGYLWVALELAGLRVWCLGDTSRAVETMAAAIEKYPLDPIDPLERPFWGLAGFYAFAGEPERARELLVEWETVVPPDLRRTREVERHAAWGAVALAEGSGEDALSHFRFVHERGIRPISGLPQLGRAYELAGQPDSALALYERYLTTPFYGRTLGGTSGGFAATLAGQSPELGFDPYWLPIVYERLGDLYEQRGDTAKAIYYYGKLVDLWKEADPELQPRVEAARRAIEALSPDT